MNICINETKLSLEVDPHLWSIEFQQWCQGSSTGEKKTDFSTNDCETTGYSIEKK